MSDATTLAKTQSIQLERYKIFRVVMLVFTVLLVSAPLSLVVLYYFGIGKDEFKGNTLATVLQLLVLIPLLYAPGVILFVIRYKMRVVYGVLEIIAAMLTIALAINFIMGSHPNSLVIIAQISAGFYVMVRGLDNCEVGLRQYDEPINNDIDHLSKVLIKRISRNVESTCSYLFGGRSGLQVFVESILLAIAMVALLGVVLFGAVSLFLSE